MHRREFIKLSAAGAIGMSTPAIARGPIERSGPPRFQIGLAAYSLRNYFSYSKGKSRKPADDGPAIDMIGFLDYCVSQNLDTAELTSYFFQPDANDVYFLDLKFQAFLRGLTISGTAIGNNFTIGKGPKLDAEIDQAIRWIDRACLLGAPHVRFFAGTGKQLAADSARLEEASQALNRCALHAAKKGIFLGVENHGGLTSEQLLEIMKRADSPCVGINLDTGNFHSDDPYRDIEKCVDFAVNVQVKVNMKTPEGKVYPADLARIGQILKTANYQGFVSLALRQNLWVELVESSESYERISVQAQQQQGRPALRLHSRHTSSSRLKDVQRERRRRQDSLSRYSKKVPSL